MKKYTEIYTHIYVRLYKALKKTQLVSFHYYLCFSFLKAYMCVNMTQTDKTNMFLSSFVTFVEKLKWFVSHGH